MGVLVQSYRLGSTATVPGAPTNLGYLNQVEDAGFWLAQITWSAPASDGGAAIDQYEVEYFDSSYNWNTATSASSPSAELAIGDAANDGIPDQPIKVRAHNSVGWGPQSTGFQGAF